MRLPTALIAFALAIPNAQQPQDSALDGNGGSRNRTVQNNAPRQ